MESAQQVAGGTNRCQCQTEVAKAHAVPQGVCENLINCWQTSRKMEMGQSGVLLQVFVKEAEMDGLRNFIEVDNHSALDVGHLKEGTRSFVVRRPKFGEGCPEVSVRRGPKELTLRTEEVGSQNACINVDHIAEDRWGPPLVDADWHAFTGRSTNLLMAETGENCANTTKK